MDLDYEKIIVPIPVSKIIVNEDNPRGIFNESEDDKLLESISEKGILNPIIVYHKEDKFVLLDGERRFRCAKKLNLRQVPAFILRHTPDRLENLSLMFHIHHAREAWSDLATAIALRKLIKELGTKDNKILSHHTSLPPYKVMKYKKLLDYDDDTLESFLNKENADKEEKLNADLLMELSRPLKVMRSYHEIADKFSEKEIVAKLVEKKNHGNLENNTELRNITRILKTPEESGLSHKELIESIIEFIDDPQITVESTYNKTSSAYYQVDKMKKDLSRITNEVEELNLKKIKKEARKELFDFLNELKQTIDRKISSVRD